MDSTMMFGYLRCKEHAGVDRVLVDPRVVFDECMCVAGELCFPCYHDKCVLGRDSNALRCRSTSLLARSTMAFSSLE